jgi:phosphatidate phosphatase APP1
MNIMNFQSVAQMRELFLALREEKNPTFFYLSASPCILYPMMFMFIILKYPRGKIKLRDIWSSLFKRTLDDIQKYKENRIEKIFELYPNMTFYLIGDSTQRDPEAYATMYGLLLSN